MRRRRTRWLLLALFGAAVATALVYRDEVTIITLQGWIESAGPAAPLLFVALYAVGTVLFLPGSIMTLAGGVLFGPLLGTFYNLLGATLGAMLAFSIARYFAFEWVARKTGPRLERLQAGVEQEGWRFVAFVRLVPLFPFNLLNYALGLTRIRFSQYWLVSAVCMLPATAAYTWLGYVGREALAGGENVLRQGLLALALLASVAFLPRLIGRMRKGNYSARH